MYLYYAPHLTCACFGFCAGSLYSAIKVTRIYKKLLEELIHEHVKESMQMQKQVQVQMQNIPESDFEIIYNKKQQNKNT